MKELFNAALALAVIAAIGTMIATYATNPTAAAAAGDPAFAFPIACGASGSGGCAVIIGNNANGAARACFVSLTDLELRCGAWVQ